VVDKALCCCSVATFQTFCTVRHPYPIQTPDVPFGSICAQLSPCFEIIFIELSRMSQISCMDVPGTSFGFPSLWMLPYQPMQEHIQIYCPFNLSALSAYWQLEFWTFKSLSSRFSSSQYRCLCKSSMELHKTNVPQLEIDFQVPKNAARLAISGNFPGSVMLSFSSDAYSCWSMYKIFHAPTYSGQRWWMVA
jgi:hypothetical protein